jgi:hypothetical protein
MRNMNLPSRFARERGALRLGCMGQIFALILILIVVGAVYVALYPWAFFMGGNFHLFGYWQGWGRMHSKTAGDYFLYVRIWTMTGRTGSIIPGDPVKGSGYICTPKGESYYLSLGGGMPWGYYVNTVGKPIHIYMHNWRDAMIISPESRPSFDLYGRWGKGELTADDHQTLSIAFLPDGTLRPKNSPTPPAQREDIQVALREGSYSEYKAACDVRGH